MDPNFFPVQERLVKGAKSEDDAVFIVDIGGSIGHDLAEFGRKHPDTPGRLVLQDLPVVLGQIASLDDKIERMPYDFYTEQPLLGKVSKTEYRCNQYADIRSRCSHILHALSAP